MGARKAGPLQLPLASDGFALSPERTSGTAFLPLSFPPAHLMVACIWGGTVRLLSAPPGAGSPTAGEEAHTSSLPRCVAQNQVDWMWRSISE